MKTDKKKDVRKGDSEMVRSTEYKAWLPRIRLIGMTYHLLVSMTAAVTFGKWLYLVHDTATSRWEIKINIPQQHYTDTHMHT